MQFGYELFMFGAFHAMSSLVQKSEFWTAIVRESAMVFASVAVGTRLDLGGDVFKPTCVLFLRKEEN